MGYTLQIKYTQGAAATIQNNLSGQPPEFIGEAAKLTLYGSADAAGDTHTLQGFRGGEVGSLLIPSSNIPVASTAGSAKTNENFIAQFAIPAGTRLVHTINGANTHTGQFIYVVE